VTGKVFESTAAPKRPTGRSKARRSDSALNPPRCVFRDARWGSLMAGTGFDGTGLYDPRCSNANANSLEEVAPMPTVYGANASPFVRKVRVFLAEKGIRVRARADRSLRAQSASSEDQPARSHPAFRDGNRTLADSSVICAYVERTHPAPRSIRAMPTTTRARSGSRSTPTAGWSR
jgi:hypothetical protein